MEFSGSTLDLVWVDAITALLIQGKRVPTERGAPALELCNVVMRIDAPVRNPPLPDRYAFDSDFVSSHIATFFEDDAENSIRTRIMQFAGTLNQLDGIVERLSQAWYSRRAVVVSWDPFVDLTSSGPPCPFAMSFMIRDNQLLMTTSCRSNDAWLAVVPDVIALTRVQADLADRLQVGMGTYTHLAVSFHIYASDLTSARSRFKDLLQ